MTRRVVVIGAGIGGLTVGALLLKAGWQVTVVEAATQPGGCAGTFYHKGFRFDAGATLAGGFDENGPHTRLAGMLGLEWPVRPIREAAWVVHLPGSSITQWTDRQRWREEILRHFPFSRGFWQLQEQLAALSWDISSRNFAWPPTSLREFVQLAASLRPASLGAAPYLLRSVFSLMPPQTNADFKAFIDAQLLISAQATSERADALYGATVLDLPRRGVMSVLGGMGAIAKTLAGWIQAHGGQVIYRQRVTGIETANGQARAVLTEKGGRIEADDFVANLTPWGLQNVLGEAAQPALRQETHSRAPMWGAFVLHVGLKSTGDWEEPHHQVVMDVNQPLGEGNSVFISLSAPDDTQRAPLGMRCATLSTHTGALEWHELYERDPAAYAARKAVYSEKLLDAAERALPGFRAAATLILPGTPRTYAFYTRRPLGMVGGFPQTSILRARSPQTGLGNMWLVGDSIFPGQSTAGVTLGAMRVASLVAG
jgi:C-3',4' desaturase CrtD